MKRILALLLALSLFVSPAFAWIEGYGWFDDSYLGTYIIVGGSDLAVKMPVGWNDCTFEEGLQIFSANPAEYPDGAVKHIVVYISTISQSTWKDYQRSAENGELKQTFAEIAWIALQDDRDWLVFANDDGLTAITPTRNGAVRLEFELDGYDAWNWARRVIGSVRSLSSLY